MGDWYRLKGTLRKVIKRFLQNHTILCGQHLINNFIQQPDNTDISLQTKNKHSVINVTADRYQTVSASVVKAV